ncbi:hypothetical protein [Plantactinospora veratri]
MVVMVTGPLTAPKTFSEDSGGPVTLMSTVDFDACLRIIDQDRRPAARLPVPAEMLSGRWAPAGASGA